MRTLSILRRGVLISPACALGIVSVAALAGCGSRGGPQSSIQFAGQPSHTVRIDAGENGAASPARSASADAHADRTPRALMFEVSGVALLPSDNAGQEQWAAAREAAVLDALAKAIMESRRGAGLSDDNFVEKLSPKLTASRRVSVDGDEFEIRLIDRGMERLFVMRDGILLHPPHDFALVRRIFTETGGAFSLLPADMSPTNRYVARVGCYEALGVESRMAGEIRTNHDSAFSDGLDADTP
ncbi:MAG: hypothetical protein KF841_10970 [Phycisphaerae bacterium]|nr:hypothetical protein [Phycisphaerae bacterium]